MLPGPSRTDRAPAPSEDRRRLSAPGYPFINEIDLPGIGSVDDISAREDDDEMFYSYTSFVSPTAIYRYDVKRRTNTLYKSATLPPARPRKMSASASRWVPSARSST